MPNGHFFARWMTEVRFLVLRVGIQTFELHISKFPPMKWAIFILKWASGFLDGRVAYLWASEIFTRPQVGEFYIYRPSHGDFMTRRIYRVNTEWAI